MNAGLLCLGILSFGEATGYEIRKMTVDGRISQFTDASSIYPALMHLTKEGLASCRKEHQSGKPSRNIYSITEEGRTALTDMLQAEPMPDRYQSDHRWLGRFVHARAGPRRS